MGTPRAQLHIVDYLVFAATLVSSLGIGIYFSLTGGKRRTNAEYLLGNRAMGIIPVTLSLMVSFISTASLLGYPAEMYAHGTQYWMGSIGIALGSVLATFLCIPVLYPLKLTSVNQVCLFMYILQWLVLLIGKHPTKRVRLWLKVIHVH